MGSNEATKSTCSQRSAEIQGPSQQSHLPEHLGELHTGVHAAPPALGLEAEAALRLGRPAALGHWRQLRRGGGRSAAAKLMTRETFWPLLFAELNWLLMLQQEV